ncbi:MAG: gluconeogenesis factor YvcK family protein [Caldilineaceae bacterium]
MNPSAPTPPRFRYSRISRQPARGDGWARALRPGLGLKRWLLLLFVGVTLAGLGFALVLHDLYVNRPWPPALDLLTLRFLPDWVRVLLLLALGFGLAAWAMWRFNQTLVGGLLPGTPNSSWAMMSTYMQRKQRRSGPRIVAIGGGTGMPQLLRGLRPYTDNLTAIVTVADDGGSSGRLRRQMGMLPPGDFRNNIAALSEAEDLMTRLFQYRFADHEVSDESGQGSTLAGHSFGNLFITTMASVTGSFEAGIAESSRVLAVRGRILPSTLEQVTLHAEIARTRDDGSEEWLSVSGESSLSEVRGRIARVFLEPERPRAYPEAIRALLQADLIVACPGSFYTSLLPNLLVPSIRDAIIASSAQKIYVCNVATEPGETEGYSVDDHVRALRRHAGDAFPVVLANSRYDEAVPPSQYGSWVTLPAAEHPADYRLYTGDLVDEALPWHHHSAKVAARLMEVYVELSAQAAQGLGVAGVQGAHAAREPSVERTDPTLPFGEEL